MVWEPRSDLGSDDAMVVSIQEAFACVCVVSSHDEAVACRDLLADHSIPTVLGASAWNIPAAGVPVLVPENLLDQANEVIACFDAADEPDECEDEPFDDDDEDDDDYDDDDDGDDFEDDPEDD